MEKQTHTKKILPLKKKCSPSLKHGSFHLSCFLNCYFHGIFPLLVCITLLFEIHWSRFQMFNWIINISFPSKNKPLHTKNIDTKLETSTYWLRTDLANTIFVPSVLTSSSSSIFLSSSSSCSSVMATVTDGKLASFALAYIGQSLLVLMWPIWPHAPHFIYRRRKNRAWTFHKGWCKPRMCTFRKNDAWTSFILDQFSWRSQNEWITLKNHCSPLSITSVEIKMHAFSNTL